ncbi:MAG: GTPase Era [Oscillospiraceae bacterium]|nr:GTPase Era [Oscillospiraceae bacterium]
MNMDSKIEFITIVGRANAGKSSLFNALVGEKIAMISAKPQTTRTRITGIVTENETQYVFMDTPGVQKAKNKLGECMNKAVKDSVADVDLILMIADCTRNINDIDRNIIAGFGKKDNVILILNKIDLISEKENIAARIAEFSSLYDFNTIIPISVREDDGVDIVREEIKKYAVNGPHYFPDDSFTDQPERVLAAEIVREKILNLMHDEVPHGTAVVVEEMKERTDRSGDDILDVSAVIYCERDSHKGMIIGKGGAMLKKIGRYAREELEEFFRIKVNLQCWVKVKEDWRNKEALIRNFGLSNNPSDN